MRVGAVHACSPRFESKMHAILHRVADGHTNRRMLAGKVQGAFPPIHLLDLLKPMHKYSKYVQETFLIVMRSKFTMHAKSEICQYEQDTAPILSAAKWSLVLYLFTLSWNRFSPCLVLYGPYNYG